MLVPILVLGIMLAVSLFSRSISGTTNRPVFLVILILVLLAFSGLRADTVGSDTARYFQRFNMLLEYDFDQAREIASIQKEPMFYMVSWGFGKVIPSPYAWFAFVSLVYLIGVAMVCYWESPDYAFSMIYMYCMGLFFFTMTGMRQALAMGVIMLSYAFAVKRKPLLFLLLVVAASYFHRTSIVFLIIYPIANLKAGWWRLLASLVVFIIILVFKDWIGGWMLRNLPDTLVDSSITDYANRNTGATASGFLIQTIMFVFCLRYRTQVVEDVPHREALYNLASVGLVFQAGSISIAEFFRVSMYFNWSFMVLIPICLQYEGEDKSYDFLRITVLTALIAYFFYSTLYSCGITPYRFLWEAPVI